MVVDGLIIPPELSPDGIILEQCDDAKSVKAQNGWVGLSGVAQDDVVYVQARGGSS